jgi:hypothetical protein
MSLAVPLRRIRAARNPAASLRTLVLRYAAA